ncbi:MAG: cytochrome c peroxidase [Thiolinea sp.]
MTAYKTGITAILVLLSVTVFGIGLFLLQSPGTAAWTPQELRTIRSLSLTNLPPAEDKSNRYAHNEKAIALGTQLFFDKRLSRNGQVSCASCHQPDNYFSDGQTIAMGQDIGRRNTPSLHGIAYNDWFFWDGRKDSLWSQALAPLENPAEHDFSRTAVARLITGDPHYYQAYTEIFGSVEIPDQQTLAADAQPSGSIAQIQAWKALPEQQRKQVDRLFANTGKALAAYVTTLKPLQTRFDDYIEALNSEKSNNQSLLNEQELRGLRLFISDKAACINCHSGPLLTNQSFHNIGSGGKNDSGRAAAISRVKLDRFNCLGEYSDAPPNQCQELKFMQTERHQTWGSFKTPSLRNVSNTAPYFHDGRYKALSEVLDHYTNAKTEDTHLSVIKLNAQDKLDLIAFLTTLTANQ